MASTAGRERIREEERKGRHARPDPEFCQGTGREMGEDEGCTGGGGEGKERWYGDGAECI